MKSPIVADLKDILGAYLQVKNIKYAALIKDTGGKFSEKFLEIADQTVNDGPSFGSCGNWIVLQRENEDEVYDFIRTSSKNDFYALGFIDFVLIYEQ